MAMRLHISIDDQLVVELDARVGTRQRSPFIAAALRRALDDERRWDAITTATGALQDTQHAWDGDPAGWVRGQRRDDPGRVG